MIKNFIVPSDSQNHTAEWEGVDAIVLWEAEKDDTLLKVQATGEEDPAPKIRKRIVKKSSTQWSATECFVCGGHCVPGLHE